MLQLEIKMFIKFSRVGNLWGISFCTTLLPAQRMNARKPGEGGGPGGALGRELARGPT